MTFPNNSNRNPNRDRVNDTNYTPWIIGGAVVVALMIGYSMMGDRPTNTAEVKSDREITTTTPSVAPVPTAPSTPVPTAPSTPDPTVPNNTAR
jgi:hypothetical protein